nr:hypothetical protein [Tanacetum cinerariifolium]
LDIDDFDLYLTPVLHSSSSISVEPSSLTSNPVRIIPSPAVKDVGEDEDCNGGVWVNATNYVIANGGTSCSSNVIGVLTVTIKDLSCTIIGTIHYKVIGEGGYRKDITVGAAIILVNVSVFIPEPSVHYLNITKKNMVKVFRKDTVLASGSEKPSCSLDSGLVPLADAIQDRDILLTVVRLLSKRRKIALSMKLAKQVLPMVIMSLRQQIGKPHIGKTLCHRILPPLIGKSRYHLNWQPLIQNIMNRPWREHHPSIYRKSPYMDLPPNTVLPKKRGGKSKNKGKKASVSPFNLGNAYNDEDVEGDDNRGTRYWLPGMSILTA